MNARLNHRSLTIVKVPAFEGYAPLPDWLLWRQHRPAAALVASVKIVSPGGRPDLAAPALPFVQSPTLLIVLSARTTFMSCS